MITFGYIICYLFIFNVHYSFESAFQFLAQDFCNSDFLFMDLSHSAGSSVRVSACVCVCFLKLLFPCVVINSYIRNHHISSFP